MLKRLLTLTIALVLCLPTMAQMATPDETIAFKTTPQRELSLHVFYPDGQKEGKKRPVVISFFGGGWNSGNVNQFFDQSRFYASLGMVGISADYRVISKDKTTPFESVMDAKSAVRWVRQNSKMLGIDPNKIVTSGGSAGGHVAACTGIIEGVEDDAKLKVSSAPNAMILFNPVVNTTEEGYGANKLVGRERELSPVHHIREGLPPTLVMHGTKDTTVPYQNAVDFTAAMVAAGNECRLVSGFGENHGLFNSPNFRKSCGSRNYNRSMYESAKFLADLGYITEELIPEKTIIRVACVGNSITFGSRVEEREKNAYPVVLQQLLGDDYEVANFGKPGATLLAGGNLPYNKCAEYQKLVEFAPDVVIVMLGTNDSKEMNWRLKDQFESDYLELLNTLRPNSERSPQIFICTPITAFTAADSKTINSAIIRDEITPIVKSVAKKSRAAALIDLNEIFAEDAKLFPDNVHPNAAGAKKMATVIYNFIAEQTAE
ncbi:MAG: GDSL-type esterase/lipase family protein [Rikenellaceae bacterium]